MSKRLFYVALAMVVLTGVAQTRYVPERSDYTFRTEVHMVCDENDEKDCPTPITSGAGTSRREDRTSYHIVRGSIGLWKRSGFSDVDDT